MGFVRNWLHRFMVGHDEATGAILVRNIASTSQEVFDLLAFRLYHTEGTEEVTWDVQFALAELSDLEFAEPLLNGDTSEDIDGLYSRVDYKGVPGQIAALTAGGIVTKLSEVDSGLSSGELLVSLDATQLLALTPGKKYIRRSRQRARDHEEWSVYHDEVIVW